MKTIEQLELLKLRTICGDLNVARQMVKREKTHVILTPTIAIPRNIFYELKPWERFEARVLAAGIATRKAVLSGFAAAAAMGIPYLSPTKHQFKVELTLPGTTCPSAKQRWASNYRYLYTQLPQDHISSSSGLRTTTIERTYLDILILYGPTPALAFIEAAMNKYRISTDAMIERVRSLGTNKGIKWAVALLNRAYHNVQSVFETLARVLLEDAKLPEIKSIVPQAKLRYNWPVYFPDLLINGFLIVEIDGQVKYEKNTEAVLLYERQRERELQRRGYTIIRFTPKEVRNQIVKVVKQTLRRSKANAVQAA